MSNLKPSRSSVEVRAPTTDRFSTIVTSTPERASNIAEASPPGPAPAMTIFFGVVMPRCAYLR
jgi:hypothetical protein